MDCSPPVSPVHGISQERILELAAISFSKRSFPPRVGAWVSYIGTRIFFFTTEPSGKPQHIRMTKFLKRWESKTILPDSCETCMQVKKQHLEPNITNWLLFGITNWFKIGKRVHQGCILSPCLFNLYAEYIMLNARLNEAQAGIKIAGRNINNLKYADDTTLTAQSKEELKGL